MTYEAEILSLLLNRYQRSGHCLPGKSSRQRVSLNMTKGELPDYRQNDPGVSSINESIQALSDEGLVTFTWRKGYENWLVDKVYLNLDRLNQAHARIDRTPIEKTAELLTTALQQSLTVIQTAWKRRFMEDELSRLQKNLRPSRLLAGDIEQAEALLKVLQYTERGSEQMRVISVNCFYDSKYLERTLKPRLVSIAKAYEPELVQYRALGEERLTESVALEQIGVLPNTEIFEFCGDIRLSFCAQYIDTGACLSGFCLQSENLERITNIELTKIKTLLFIENKTNYRHVVLQGCPGDLLAVFLGGFYSPRKRKLLSMIANAIEPSVRVLYWGDIDLGGFLMYTRLKKDLFPGLTPWKMGLCDYETYADYGFVRPSSYLELLRDRMRDEQFDSVFLPVAHAILEKGTTVEQELML